MPAKPGPIQQFVQLAQQVRDLPGAPLQKAIALTQEASDLVKEADKAAGLAKTQLDDANRLLDAADAVGTNDPAEYLRLLNASNSARAQSNYWRDQSVQMKDLASYKLQTLREPYMQQLKAFLSDK